MASATASATDSSMGSPPSMTPSRRLKTAFGRRAFISVRPNVLTPKIFSTSIADAEPFPLEVARESREGMDRGSGE